MVKSAPEIVDSIAYCQGDFSRRIAGLDRENMDAVFRIRLTSNSVKVLFSQKLQLPFRIADVMIGSINL